MYLNSKEAYKLKIEELFIEDYDNDVLDTIKRDDITRFKTIVANYFIDGDLEEIVVGHKRKISRRESLFSIIGFYGSTKIYKFLIEEYFTNVNIRMCAHCCFYSFLSGEVVVFKAAFLDGITRHHLFFDHILGIIGDFDYSFMLKRKVFLEFILVLSGENKYLYYEVLSYFSERDV